MHRIYQAFIDSLVESVDVTTLRESMSEAVRAMDLSCFAYLCVPERKEVDPQLISTYPSAWTAHYLRNHYERFDPVIIQALANTEPFQWGLSSTTITSGPQQELFEEAAKFGIFCGYTVPIHNRRGPIAAVTFAADEYGMAAFRRRIEEHSQALQLMAMCFHAHARRRFAPGRVVNGVSLSPREFECLEWAAQGKSAWETGCILGISRYTAATYLENAKTKLGVRSVVQAVALLAASKVIIP